MKIPLVANALVSGLTVLTVLLFLGHTVLFFGKNLQPWYYDLFPTPMEQFIAFLSIPLGAIVAWIAKKVFVK